METDDVILFTAFPLTKYSNSLSPRRTNPRKRSVPTRDVTATPAGSRALPPLREPSEARRHRAHGARDRTTNSARELPLLQTGPRAARTRQTHSARSGSGGDRREARPRSAGPAARPEPGRCGRRRAGGGGWSERTGFGVYVPTRKRRARTATRRHPILKVGNFSSRTLRRM